MICVQDKEIMIGTTSSRILYQLRDKYTICRCCWNVATHKMESSQWENWNNLFCGKFSFLILYIYMCLWLIVLNDIYDLIPVTSWPPFIFVSFVYSYSFEHCIAWPTFFLRFKASDFLFGILKLFFQWMVFSGPSSFLRPSHPNPQKIQTNKDWVTRTSLKMWMISCVKCLTNFIT